MIPRAVFLVLLAGLCIFMVAFAVLMAFYALVTEMGDEMASKTLFWTANGCLIVAAIDLLLLVAALGLQASQAPQQVDRQSERHD